MTTTSSNKFNFFVPLDIEKGSDNKGGTLIKIKGVASSEAEDSDGETLIPTGFDFGPLLKSGFLNWNHQAGKTAKAICGEPTAAKVINNGKDFYIEGFLYPNAQGKEVAELAETLEKYSPNRRLGFSIEGQATEKDPLNPKKITKARITGVAITQSPKNPNTLMSIVKGEIDHFFIEGEEVEEIMKGGIEEVMQEFKNGTLRSSDGSLVTDRKQAIAIGLSQEKAMEEKEGTTEKAMDTAAIGPAMPESVEGKKIVNVAGGLNKSEIYLQIYDRYTQDVQKAREVYDFVSAVNEKYFSMTKESRITSEALTKAFEILDNSIEKSEKSNVDKVEENEEKAELGAKPNNDEDEPDDDEPEDDESDEDEPDEDEDLRKADACYVMAKGLIAEGMAKEAVVKAMTSCGIDPILAKVAAESCIEEASNLDANGGEVSSGAPTIQKSREIDEDLIKGLEDNLGGKFSALGQILKSFVDEREELRGVIDNLQKGLNDTREEVEKINRTPIPSKSVRSARAIERFAKGEEDSGEVYNVANRDDIKKLSNRLYAEVELIKSHGNEDNLLEKAVMDLEISKSTNYEALVPRLRAMNISLVRE